MMLRFLLLPILILAVFAEEDLHAAIDRLRKSNIHIKIAKNRDTDTSEVQLRVRQLNKSFPFGMAVSADKYNDHNTPQCYRDFIHKNFNWAVLGNALKWPAVEPSRNHQNCGPALSTIHGLKNHGLKVRGHNLVWSVDQWVQDWVKGLSGDDLRNAVRHHIQATMGCTRGLLEHWDVINESLHGAFFRNRLHDDDYMFEIFREAHSTDSGPKLFLNDYNVVAGGSENQAYLNQAYWVKGKNVGLYGLGCQCHFGNEEDPNPGTIKQRLDNLAKAGLPLWATELDVQAQDDNRRADFYEHALTALYAHHAVKGILLWGFWDQNHWRGAKAALVDGNNCQVNAAGRRVLNLIHNQWMSDEIVSLNNTSEVTIRGFHGDYELEVIQNGKSLKHLKKNFNLGEAALNMTVHI